MAAKYKDGKQLEEKRPCWDYRRPNDLTVSDSHPLPLLGTLFGHLKGSRLYSKMDLTKGFWQIPLAKESREVLAFSTPIGLMQPKCMPFGIKNAPATFQREMQRVFKERLYKGVLVFVDDILIYSSTVEEQVELVEFVLRRLQEEGYYASPDKCEWFKDKVSFLGHVISGEGIEVQAHKVKAVREWPVPQTKRDVRAFLGMAGYYRRFIHEYGRIASPLNELTGKEVAFVWTDKHQQAFETVKDKLTSAPVLAHPDPEKQYILHTDASGFAVSGVLSQDTPEGRRPIAFYSKKMNGAETRYPVHEQELLAIVRAVEHWRCYLHGSPHETLILSDHGSLKWLSTQPNLSSRQARWVESLTEIEYRIEHLPGKENVVADALSRRADHERQVAAESNAEKQEAESGPVRPRLRITTVEVNAVDTPQAWEVCIKSVPLLADMKQAAERDPTYQQQLKTAAHDGLTVGDGLLWTSEGVLYVPDDRELQRRLMYEAHDALTGGHMGGRKTCKKLQAMCYWPGMKADIEGYVRSCVVCAAVKPSQQKPAGTLRPLPIPHAPWKTITIDFIGILPRTPSYHDTILTVVDKFTKMGHFIPTTQNVTAKGTARLLIKEIVTRHGLPDIIISDRDTRFTAALWQEIWKQFGTELKMSTSYHPQSNGQTEIVNKMIETRIRAYCNKQRNNWEENLCLLEASYNSSVHESTGQTPFAMNGVVWEDAMGKALRMGRGEMKVEGAREMMEGLRTTWEDARQLWKQKRERQRKYADQSRREEKYEVGDQVMLSTENLAVGRGKLTDLYIGPFRVMEVLENGVSVRLQLPEEMRRVHDKFHIEKLKRYQTSAVEWPGRVQEDRPPPEFVDGREEWEIERIIGKKEEDVSVKVGGDEEESEEEEKADKAAEAGDEQADLRRSSRLQSRGGAAGMWKPTRRKRKTPPRVEKRRVVMYLCKWKGYPEESAEWKQLSDLSHAMDLVDEYEHRQEVVRGEDSAGEQWEYRAVNEGDGVVTLQQLRVQT
jgi:transposase InsO family protein